MRARRRRLRIERGYNILEVVKDLFVNFESGYRQYILFIYSHGK
jgi:hypothetical protein